MPIDLSQAVNAGFAEFDRAVARKQARRERGQAILDRISAGQRQAAIDAISVRKQRVAEVGTFGMSLEELEQSPQAMRAFQARLAAKSARAPVAPKEDLGRARLAAESLSRIQRTIGPGKLPTPAEQKQIDALEKVVAGGIGIEHIPQPPPSPAAEKGYVRGLKFLAGISTAPLTASFAVGKKLASLVGTRARGVPQIAAAEPAAKIGKKLASLVGTRARGVPQVAAAEPAAKIGKKLASLVGPPKISPAERIALYTKYRAAGYPISAATRMAMQGGEGR